MYRRLVLSVLLLFACADTDPSALPPVGEPPVLAVTVLEARPENIPASFEVVAQVEGARETEVRARVGGILEKRLYEEGEKVEAGAPLFLIDPSSYEIALADAEARADQAAREKNRLAKLIAANAVSEKAYDDALSAHDVAQAALQRARLDLSWTTVTAPVAGTTGRALRSEGSLVSPGEEDVLTTIHQLDPIWVRFSLSEGEIARLPGGAISAESVAGIELLLPDGSAYPHPGRINFLASTIDLELGTRQLRAEFDNPDERLLPGMFVRVRLVTHDRPGVFRVPQDAVIQTMQGHQVMLAGDGNQVEARPVRTGEWLGTDWIILDGLERGDRVIVDHLMQVHPGVAVEPHVAEPAAESATAPPHGDDGARAEPTRARDAKS
jgi:membrane fusion protein (multidrug efflux system)